jgi:3-oxoacyl-[acyl-carrier-protein] synthase II
MRRRVVVTGLGAISAMGIGVDTLWKGLLEGRSCGKLITKFDTEGYPCRVAAEISDFDPSLYIDKKELRYLDPSHQYGHVAAAEAIGDSGFINDDFDPERCGSIIGTAHGGATTFIAQYEIMLNRGINKISPFGVQMMFSDMPSALFAIKYNLRGPNHCTVAACASGTIAIGHSFRAIQHNEADIMVSGGTDSSLHPFSLAGFCREKAVTCRNDEPAAASRPFDKDRDGFLIGEGSGIVVLEELEHALKRNAKIYAEIIGYGATCDAYHRVAPEPDGKAAAESMRLAVEDAGIRLEDIDYINAHGTATILGDVAETRAIKSLFGDHAYRLTISSSKSMIGHLMGGAGGIEALITTLSVKKDKIHPTINLQNPDPECDLDYSANRVTEKEINYALSNSFGFGGRNAILVITKYRG